MTTLQDEIEEAIRALRRQHELEASQCERLEQHMEAHSADLIDRIRGIRHREAHRRSEAARELFQLASEIGRVPMASPEPASLDSEPPLRMPNCISQHPAYQALDDVVLQ